jgi:hypothetical protein
VSKVKPLPAKSFRTFLFRLINRNLYNCQTYYVFIRWPGTRKQMGVHLNLLFELFGTICIFKHKIFNRKLEMPK